MLGKGKKGKDKAGKGKPGETSKSRYSFGSLRKNAIQSLKVFAFRPQGTTSDPGTPSPAKPDWDSIDPFIHRPAIGFT